jgi:fatty acid desaturase
MAKSSADDVELRRACEAAIEDPKQKIILSLRVAKSHGILGKSSKLGRQMAKPRVLALSSNLFLFMLPISLLLILFVVAILLVLDFFCVLALKILLISNYFDVNIGFL